MNALRESGGSPRPERMIPADRDSSDVGAATTIRAPYIMVEQNDRSYPQHDRLVDSEQAGTTVRVLRSESPGRVTYWLVE